jgi:glutathione S-transferase
VGRLTTRDGSQATRPVRVYGSKVSYYTGKLEAYFRYKGIAYELLPLAPHRKKLRVAVGATQMPCVELADGRWMSDTTPMIQFFERQMPTPSVLPSDPALRFIALLIEDYADEWLWRPAMHYRWSHRHDRELLSSILVDEQTGQIPLPRFVKVRAIRRRQRGGFVIRDGVTSATRRHVESSYFAALDNMTRMLERRPFLLGDAPSIADFGLMGPMLRHFGQDPTPSELMRRRAPAVYEWVARMWNLAPSTEAPIWESSLPDDAQPMIQECCETHLAALAHNASAFRQDIGRFAMTIQGCPYAELPVSRYRVWCLERLRKAFRLLGSEEQSKVKSSLHSREAEILWSSDFRDCSGYDEAEEAPFNRAIHVFGNGVPA